MNADYLFSVIDLYLSREKDKKKTNLSIQKKDNKIYFKVNMKQESADMTEVYIPLDNINDILGKVLYVFKKELMIIDEKYSFNKNDNTCYYYVQFNNGRTISFNGFSVLELNNIRNVLFDIKINKEEIRVSEIDEEKVMAYKPQLRLQQTGFSSYGSLFLIVLFFADILVISLWIFKLIIK